MTLEEIKEAIEVIKAYRQTLTDSVSTLLDGDIKAFDMAVEAMEQEPCGDCIYCHEDSDGYVIPLEKNSHAFIRLGMDGWELSLHAKGWHGSAKIKYCPMCGRKLMSRR